MSVSIGMIRLEALLDWLSQTHFGPLGQAGEVQLVERYSMYGEMDFAALAGPRLVKSSSVA